MNIALPKLFSGVTVMLAAGTTGAVGYFTQQCPALADWRNLLPGAAMAAFWAVAHLYQAKPQKKDDVNKQLDTTLIPK